MLILVFWHYILHYHQLDISTQFCCFLKGTEDWKESKPENSKHIRQMASLKPVNLHLLTLYLWATPFIFQPIP